MEVPECDYIISNPPYSKKTEVFKRLFEINKPFAMLVGLVGLFENQRFKLFQNRQFEEMRFDKRIAFFKDYVEEIPSAHPPYASGYICSGILPQQIVFAELKKKGY